MECKLEAVSDTADLALEDEQETLLICIFPVVELEAEIVRLVHTRIVEVVPEQAVTDQRG
jgi:hypothetical protein